MRDTRIQLERDGDAAWEVACKMAAALEGLERDEADADLRAEEAYLRQRQLGEVEQKLELDVMLIYRLLNGQVDLPDPAASSGGLENGPSKVTLGDNGTDSLSRGKASSLNEMGNACILNRLQVERVNESIIERGLDKVWGDRTSAQGVVPEQ